MPFILLLIIISGCGDNAISTAVDQSPDKVACSITYSSGVVEFKNSEMTDLVKIDSANDIFYFKKTNSKAAQLKAGDIIVINNYTIRKVTDIVDSSNIRVVNTEFVTFTEAVKDCDINYDVLFDMSPKTYMKALKNLKGANIQVNPSNNDFNFQYKTTDFLYTVSGTFAKGQCTFKVIVDKRIVNTKVASMEVTVVLKSYRAKGVVRVVDHQLVQYDQQDDLAETEATINFKFAGSGDNIGIELPLDILPPIPVEGLPFLLFKTKLYVVMNAICPPDGSSIIAARVKYSASEGLTYHKDTRDCTPTGTVKTVTYDGDGTPHTASASPISVSWGIGLPRFEIEFLKTTLGSVMSAYLIGGNYTTFPACQQAILGFYGSYSWGLGAFGVTIVGGKGPLWKYEKCLLNVGQCNGGCPPK
ncbi:MAG: hypothetical protein NT007_16990 [Candidatus Kapabacteria bacterium]|nr:hypothetical protein [Candidatus Kapabacteria bacterium]